MKVSFSKIVFAAVLLVAGVGLIGYRVQAAAQPDDTYYRAEVEQILQDGQETVDGQSQMHQLIRVRILNGDEVGKEVTIDHGGTFAIAPYQRVSVGEQIVITKPADSPTPDFYYVVDTYRVPDLLYAALIFFALAIFFGRKRGFTSIVGMLFSVLVIFYYIIPRIASGSNPITVALIGSVAIVLVSLYLSHGFNRRTTIALVSTLLALVLAVGVDVFFVHLAHLAGNGTEEAFYLQMDTTTIDLQGLLLGGIIIGVLGVLDDVTTGQAAAIEEIFNANPRVSFSQLYRSGLSVGREHIASLINTLVLAYTGASFPLLLLYATQRSAPLWVTFNSNFIAEESIRTLVGSSVLVVAVPLTTLLAAYAYTHLFTSNRT